MREPLFRQIRKKIFFFAFFPFFLRRGVNYHLFWEHMYFTIITVMFYVSRVQVYMWSFLLIYTINRWKKDGERRGKYGIIWVLCREKVGELNRTWMDDAQRCVWYIAIFVCNMIVCAWNDFENHEKKSNLSCFGNWDKFMSFLWKKLLAVFYFEE